jgi:hypothetical protein
MLKIGGMYWTVGRISTNKYTLSAPVLSLIPILTCCANSKTNFLTLHAALDVALYLILQIVCYTANCLPKIR